MGLIYFPDPGSDEWYQGMNNNKIAWKIIELRRRSGQGSNDRTTEAALTYAATVTLTHLLTGIQSQLEGKCSQDITSFEITDKTMGEISLSWYGDVFELDLDVTADGGVDYLLCWTGDKCRTNWVSTEGSAVCDFLDVLKGYTSASV